MFEFSEKPLEDFVSSTKITDNGVGGLVIFEGRVRNNNEGFDVKSLEYQAYLELGHSEGNKIINEALKKFDINEAACFHRIGHLQIAEMAIWVITAAKHRKEAFLACEYIVDQVKTRVPIWKKEHYIDKESVWVACHQCQQHSEYSHEHK